MPTSVITLLLHFTTCRFTAMLLSFKPSPLQNSDAKSQSHFGQQRRTISIFSSHCLVVLILFLPETINIGDTPVHASLSQEHFWAKMQSAVSYMLQIFSLSLSHLNIGWESQKCFSQPHASIHDPSSHLTTWLPSANASPPWPSQLNVQHQPEGVHQMVPNLGSKHSYVVWHNFYNEQVCCEIINKFSCSY